MSLRDADVKTIGILYPGEMGVALGNLLSSNGFHVVTTLEGRSARTCRPCAEAGLQILDSLRDVIQVADIIITLVPPSAALPLAQRYCSLADRRPHHQVYIDANSVSPDTVAEIGALLSEKQICFVDAAIYGLASRLGESGALYLSGAAAQEIAELFPASLRTRVLGGAPGLASTFKMLIGGMNKGLVALFLELSLVAREADLFDDILASYEEYYPGIMTVIERLLPTYPRHARRRGEEMKELERTMQSLGLHSNMIHGARRTITAVGELELAELKTPQEAQAWSIEDVIEAVYNRNPLRQA